VSQPPCAQEAFRHRPPAPPPPPLTSRGSTHKPQHKTHNAGYSRVGHARNPSYGKNLHKLTRIHGNDENVATAHGTRRQHTPSTSPSAQNLRRNASMGTSPRVGSKTSVQRNSLNLSLKRNGSSATQLGKNRQTDSAFA
jgi:hypothetical protein